MNLAAAFELVAKMGANFPDSGCCAEASAEARGENDGGGKLWPETGSREISVPSAITSFPFGRFFEVGCPLCLKFFSGYLQECPHCTLPQIVLE